MKASGTSAAVEAARRRMLRAADFYDQGARELRAARKVLTRDPRAKRRRKDTAAVITLEVWALDAIDSVRDTEPDDVSRFLREDARPGGLEQSLADYIRQECLERAQGKIRKAA